MTVPAPASTSNTGTAAPATSAAPAGERMTLDLNRVPDDIWLQILVYVDDAEWIARLGRLAVYDFVELRGANVEWYSVMQWKPKRWKESVKVLVLFSLMHFSLNLRLYRLTRDPSVWRQVRFARPIRLTKMWMFLQRKVFADHIQCLRVGCCILSLFSCCLTLPHHPGIPTEAFISVFVQQ